VSFSIALKTRAEAEVTWSMSKDGVDPKTSGKVALKDGKAVITGKLDEPGFLLCRVTSVGADKKPISAMAGAAVDPLKIRPSQPVPADFDSFWTAEKAKLAKIPVEPKFTPVPAPYPTVETFDVQAPSMGKPVSAYLAKPKGAKPKSLPIILTVHGAGVSSSSLGGASNWANLGFLAMDMNAHGIPNGKPKEYYTALYAGELKDYRAIGLQKRETVYFHEMFLRLVRALDVLTAQPEWDGKTVVVYGSSQGGYQAIVAAGLDPRVTFFAAGVPAGCDHTGFKVGRVNGWPKFIATGQVNPPADVVKAVRYYDAVNFASRAKAGAIFTVGFIDTTCPPTSVFASYNALHGPREIFHDITAGHTNTPTATAAVKAAILAHVKGK